MTAKVDDNLEKVYKCLNCTINPRVNQEKLYKPTRFYKNTNLFHEKSWEVQTRMYGGKGNVIQIKIYVTTVVFETCRSNNGLDNCWKLFPGHPFSGDTSPLISRITG